MYDYVKQGSYLKLDRIMAQISPRKKPIYFLVIHASHTYFSMSKYHELSFLSWVFNEEKCLALRR